MSVALRSRSSAVRSLSTLIQMPTLDRNRDGPMTVLKPVRRSTSEDPVLTPGPTRRDVSVASSVPTAASQDSAPASPAAWCTALFFGLFALMVAGGVAAHSNWHNPLLIIFIVGLAVWGRAHTVKVTSSQSTEDSHATCLNGVCIVALAALNGPLPALLAAFASELAPFVSSRFHYAGRRSTVSDLACNLACAGGFALFAGVALNTAGDALGHGVAFFLIVFAVSIVADLISLLLLAAHNSLCYRQSSSDDLVRYLEAWRTLFPALALSTAVLVITLWVDRTSGPAAFTFAALAFVSIQGLLARISRVEYELRQERDKVSWLAHHDSLTGLWNRLALDDQLTTATEPASDDRVALVFIDLDDFKQINDVLGHVAGDELLREVAERLVLSARDHDRVFRQGGDEFLIVARVNDEGDAPQIVQRAEAIFENPFSVGGTSVEVTGSLGVAEWPQEANDGEALLHLADSRMYERKALAPARAGSIAAS
jgi:diguanylate cyclase (GGDEF)-like protein